MTINRTDNLQNGENRIIRSYKQKKRLSLFFSGIVVLLPFLPVQRIG